MSASPPPSSAPIPSPSTPSPPSHSTPTPSPLPSTPTDVFSFLLTHFPLHTSCPLQSSLISIILAPLLWNIFARICNSTVAKSRHTDIKYLTCYALTVWIFSFSSYRDLLFHRAIEALPKWDFLLSLFALSPVVYNTLVGTLFIVGFTLTFSSFLRLGITGTFLGDYCGIFMSSRVSGFPFNLMANPMYNGSVMIFMSGALWEKSLAGIILSALVFIVYRVACVYEESYTNEIYREKEERERGEGKRKRN